MGRKPRRAHDCTIATLFLAPGSALAPKGRKDSAQGFNPGLDITFAGALKAALDPRRVGKAIHLERIQSGATFRAHSVGTTYPGLKPWAKSLCPFGAGPWAKSYRCFGALSSRPVLDLSPVTFHLSHSSL
jgi:hypothetical protein